MDKKKAYAYGKTILSKINQLGKLQFTQTLGIKRSLPSRENLYFDRICKAGEYEDSIYINFDENPHFASFFHEDLDPNRIIKELNIYFKRKIHPASTLIVLDEIQECPQALACLKYFCEKK